MAATPRTVLPKRLLPLRKTKRRGGLAKVTDQSECIVILGLQ